jgi:hypothetical protein
VEALARKYGKKQLLKLLKMAAKVKSRTKFDKVFKEVYGFAPNYENMSALLKYE